MKVCQSYQWWADNLFYMELINQQWVESHVHHRKAEGHKKSFGHVLVIAGSEGKAGAAILCARAALHSGCGMVTAMIPKEAVQVLLKEQPELMYMHETAIHDIDLTKYDAIAIGPGIGFSDLAKMNLKYVLSHYIGPVVIDADALTIVADETLLLKSNHIVTPHPGEFARLQGFDYDPLQRAEQANNFIEKQVTVLVLKGAQTIVGCKGQELLQNTTGNDGMATAGSGDVLTGIIVSLCAQGYDVYTAAAIGVYLHGLAGDTAIKEISKASLVASDIIHYIGMSRIID